MGGVNTSKHCAFFSPSDLVDLAPALHPGTSSTNWEEDEGVGGWGMIQQEERVMSGTS